MGYLAEELDLSAEYYHKNADNVKKKINILLWVGPEEAVDWIRDNRKEWLYPLKRVEVELVERPFYFTLYGIS